MPIVEPIYIVGLYETQVLVGRISRANLDRARSVLTNRPGPEGEIMEVWGSGTRAQLRKEFGPELDESDFDHADELYMANKTHQFIRDRIRS